MFVRRGWGLVALTAVACSSGAGGPDAGGPLDRGAPDLGSSADVGVAEDAGEARDLGPEDASSSTSERLAEAECRFLERCREAEFLLGHGDSLTCTATRGAAWRAHLSTRADPAADVQAEACLGALAAAACWQDPWALGGSCHAILGRGRPDGAGCARSSDCATGYCASADPGLACGTCRPFLGLDGDCRAEPSAACGATGACVAGRCTLLPGIAQGCAGTCQGYLDCPPDSEAWICVPPIEAGDSCEILPFGGGPHCPPERLLACVAERCAPAIWVGPGELCGVDRWCRSPLDHCADTGRCEPRPVVARGESCGVPRCAEQDWCDDSGHCAGRIAQGAPCPSDQACAVGLACLGAERRCLPAPSLVCP